MAEAKESTALSLFRVGPLFRLWARLLRDPESVPARSLALLAVAWAPFALLAVVGALTTDEPDPLLLKLPVHVRWAVSVPLLLAAENFVEGRVRASMRYLRAARVIQPPIEPSVWALETHATALCASPVAEMVMLAVSVAVSAAETQFSAPIADLWHNLVALTVYRFLLLRWMHRWGIWTWVAFQLSRLELTPNGMHPDRAGGLGALSQPSRGFGVVLIAMGTVVASVLGMRMQAGDDFGQLAPYIASYVVAGLVLTLLPMFPFVLVLARARRRILYGLGEFARGYVDAFEAKWLPHGGESALGSSDIQSLNDLGGAYSTVVQMRVFPFSTQFIVEIVVMALLPILPLYMASLSVDQLASALIGIVF